MKKVSTLALSIFLGTMSALAAPTVNVSNPIVALSSVFGGKNPPPQSVTITTDQPASLTGLAVTYVAGGTNWLLVSPISVGQALPLTVQLFVDATNLVPGTYIANVQLVFPAPVDPASSTLITVFLSVAPPDGGVPSTVITSAPASLSFTYQAGGSNPLPQSLTVSTNDGTSFSAAAKSDDPYSWLTATPAASTSPGTVTVTVDASKLNPGTYTGNINLAVPPYAITQVPVTLIVAGPNLLLNPAAITIVEPQDYGFSVSMPVQITAPTPFQFTLTALSDRNWLSIDTQSGTTPATINVRANDAGLAQGTYNGSVIVQTGPSTQFTLPVTLTVGPPATLSLQPSSLTFTAQAGDTAPLNQPVKVNSINGLTQSFTVSSNAAWVTANAVPASTPGLVNVTVNPAGMATGSYFALVTITPTTAGASAQQVSVNLTVAPPPKPIISAVTNAASYAAGAVAPGEYVTIFGSGLGPAVLATPTPGTAPNTLGNTSVTFDGIPAPILYASAGQTTVQVPYAIASGQTVLVVTTRGISSAPANVPSLPAFPGLFTASASGQGPLAALNADLSVNSAANPAARGAAIVLYGTGEGMTQPGAVEGTIVASAPLPSAVAPVSVTIGGVPATVQYAGETPGTLAGLMQINATVPASVTPGPSVPVQVIVGGQATQATVTISVK